MRRYLLYSCTTLILQSCLLGISTAGEAVADLRMDLAGQWRFQLDPEDRGRTECWFESELADRIPLPGTTDQAGKGYRLRAETMNYEVSVPESDWPGAPTTKRIDEAGHLVRPWLYIGKAWYQRDIDIPTAWGGKRIRLSLERVTWVSDVWIDERYVGSTDSLVTEHNYDLGPLAPGRHRLTIRVDNGLRYNIGILGHAYGPETQSRWNGIVGRIALTAVDPVHVRQVRVFPAADRHSVCAELYIQNAMDKAVKGVVNLAVMSERGTRRLGAADVSVDIPRGEKVWEVTVTLDEPGQPWDEFGTPRYRLVTELATDTGQCSHTARFGFRHIERVGRRLQVNGRRIFLRGTLDCCGYPKTGHPPVTVRQWLEVLGTIKEYGFNHVRYHTWCPPEAAFEAADQLGLYLAPETPYWVDRWSTEKGTRPAFPGQDKEVVEYVRREMRRISDAYGNHPSFAFFSIGNEFAYEGSDWQAVNEWLAELKRYDPRRLYNATAARRRLEADDYWVTHSTGKASTRGVGPANTQWDFAKAAESVDLPLVAHETGQRPVFPDYADLLPKFSGPLKPYNYERLLDRLTRAGLLNRVKDFERASAKFQLVQYKAEHEAMLRTRDYAGYQLLMLNDFTGQSEALVGILDPFWESKGVIGVDEVVQWNSPTTVLARFAKYVWTDRETFEAQIEVAHYGPDDLTAATAEWTLSTTSDERLAQGELGPANVSTGGVTSMGRITAPLASATGATALLLRVRVGDAVNQWRLWVYPARGDEKVPANVVVTSDFEKAHAALEQGERVVFMAHGVTSARSKKTGFLSVYWSAGWWGDAFSSLGVLCDPSDPALAQFPNDGHSDWQWHQLTQGATTFLLDGTPPGYRPIVESVTDFHHNRLLGHVFEARVGRGRLLVCGYDLESNLNERPATRQMRRSLLSYAAAGAFQPEYELGVAYLRELFKDAER